MQNAEVVGQLKNLVNEGATILENFPNKTQFAEEIRQVKQQYKQDNPADLPKLFGTRVPSSAMWLKNTIDFNHRANMNEDIEQRKLNYSARVAQLENRFMQWYASALEALRTAGIRELVPQLINAKSSPRLDSKFRRGIAVLEKALHLLSDEGRVAQPLLIQKGQPITAMNQVKEILRGCTSFVKIQDPYADMELLEAIESVGLDVNIKLLLGKTACPSEQFAKGLAKLKKSGRRIEAVFILDGTNAPFHDRYIFSEKKAFSLGTSMNGFGLRDSSIIPLQEWTVFETKFDQYFAQGTK